MTMLITKSQGAACRRAAERIAEGHDATLAASAMNKSLESIGWASDTQAGTWFDWDGYTYDQSQVILALLWCAEIAGSE